MTQGVIGGDGVYYYANLRSLVIDGDLDFDNEYAAFHHQASAFTGNRKIPEIPPRHPVTNRLPNKYPLGSSIALAPFFILGQGLSWGLRLLGLPIATDGYGLLTQFCTGLGGLLYGAAGLYLIYFVGRRLYGAVPAFIGAIAIGTATPLIYYMMMEPLMSHTLSMAGVSAFLTLWLMTRPQRSLSQWIGLGLLGGLMALIRYQDGLFVWIPVADAIALQWGWAQTRQLSTHTAAALGCRLLAFSLSIIAVFSLQLGANTYLYGSPWTTGYEGEGFPYLLTPRLLHPLFSVESGLFLWSPVLLLATLGLWQRMRQSSLTNGLMLVAVLMQWYLVSAWSSLGQGHSFGNRLLLNILFIFALGLIHLMRHLHLQSQALPQIGWGLGGLILVNGVLAGLYCFRVIGNPY